MSWARLDMQYFKDVHSPQIDVWFQCYSTKNLRVFFEEINKPILKFLLKCKGCRIANTKGQQSQKTCIPDFKTCYKATTIKTIRH